MGIYIYIFILRASKLLFLKRYRISWKISHEWIWSHSNLWQWHHHGPAASSRAARIQQLLTVLWKGYELWMISDELWIISDNFWWFSDDFQMISDDFWGIPMIYLSKMPWFSISRGRFLAANDSDTDAQRMADVLVILDFTVSAWQRQQQAETQRRPDQRLFFLQNVGETLGKDQNIIHYIHFPTW